MIDGFENYLLSTPEDQLDIAEYLLSNIGLVADPEGLSGLLYSDFPQKQIGDFVLASIRAYDYEERNRKHIKGHKADFYAIYSLFADPSLRFPKPLFLKYFKCINDIELEKTELKCRHEIIDSVSLLRSNGVDDDLIKSAYRKLCDYKLVTAKDLWPDTDDFYLNSNPSYQETVRRFISRLKFGQSDVLQFLAYLHLDPDFNDIILENRFLLPRAESFSRQTGSGPVVFIDPSFYLIKSLLFKRYPFKDKQTLFFIRDVDFLDLLNSSLKHNKNFRFFHIDDFEDIVNDPECKPSLSMLFFNHSDAYAQNLNCFSALLNNIADSHAILALIPDAFLRDEGSTLKDLLLKTAITRVELLPSGIENATQPKRKSLIYARYGYIDPQDTTEVFQYGLYKNNSRIISGKPFRFNVAACDLFFSSQSLRNRYRALSMEQLSKSSVKANKASIYDYSSEIRVSYTKSGKGTSDSPYRIQAYILLPDNGHSSGRRIDTTKGSTKLRDNENLFEWLNSYLFSSRKHKGIECSVQEETSKVFIPIYKGKAVTLKTFLYIHPELLKELPGYASDIYTHIRKSFLSDMTLDKINKDILLVFADEAADVVSFSRRQLFNVLSRIFEIAVDNGNSIRNPAKDLLADLPEEDLGLASVRSALTKKFFYPEEIEKIIRFADRQISSGSDIPLGMAIYLRLCLGLEANLVSALKWKDFHSEKSCSYISICRQVNNQGSEYLPLSSRELYRKLPIIEYLNDLLLVEKTRQLKQLADNNEEYLKECSVISGNDFVLNGQSRIYSPIKLNKKIRKLIKRIGADPDILTIPDNDYGTIETNIAYYTGDIFKTNYWHYLVKENPDIGIGELYYLLGNKLSRDTLSNHYIDYGNRLSLKRLSSLQPDFERNF